ncbi:MAG: enoyl-CoA hydratase/isomerase family protein [Alicyclobacillus sp.]|nr:enoyl-CoA hydratase/isomerase family protein [Alicyclobacillus sp.]
MVDQSRNHEPVRYTEKNGIAYVELNRPESRNAFNYDTLCALWDVVQDLKLKRSILTIIFHGAGDGFSAGADLKERRTLGPREVHRNVSMIRDTFTAIERLPQPTIAVLHGFALGGGFELALACDFRFAAKSTLMGLVETSLAIIPGAGGTQRLPRLIGPMQAKRLIFTATRIGAQEAYELGILTGIGETKADAMTLAEQLAGQIARNGPLAVIQAKHAIDRGLGLDMASGLDIETQAYEVLIPTLDRLEAIKAFEEKRAPQFRGE